MRGSPHGPAPAKTPASGQSTGGDGQQPKPTTKDRLKDASSNKGSAQRLAETRGKKFSEKARVATTELAVQIGQKFAIPPQVVRIVMVAVFALISVLLFFMLVVLLLATAAALQNDEPLIHGNAAKVSRPSEKRVPDNYEKQFKRAAQRTDDVPWTLLAAISQLGTDLGQVAPYPEDTVDRDPDRENLRAPGGATSGMSGAAPVAATDAKVFILGDSVTVGVAPELTAKLTSQGWQVEIDAAVSRGLTMKGQQGQPTGNEALDAAVAASKIGGTFVMALGTNGPATVNAASIDAVMSKIPKTTRVFWPTVAYGAGASGDPNGANAEIAAAAARHPNLTVLQWRPNPADLDQYGHPTTAASKTARVDLIANALGSYTGASSTPVPSSTSTSAPAAAPASDVKTSTYPKVSPPIGTDTQAQGPFLIYPSAVNASDINPQDLRSRGGRTRTATDWVAKELQAIRDDLVKDEGWKFTSKAEKAAVWTEAVRRLAVADPIEAACAATIWDPTLPEDVANAVEGLWRCELNYAKALNVQRVSAETGEALAVDDPATVVTAEALDVAWAFSNWGQAACDPNASGPAGVFPLTQDVFDAYNDGYDGKTRCDQLANIHAAARAFAAAEAVKPGTDARTADAGAFNPVLGGWATMPWALGDDAARAKLIADGPVAAPEAPEPCIAEVDEWLGANLDSFGDFAGVASPLTDEDRARLGATIDTVGTAPYTSGACAGLPPALWARTVAAAASESAEALNRGANIDQTTAPSDDPSALPIAGQAQALTGLATYFADLAATDDSDSSARPGVDSVVARLSSSGRVLDGVPPTPPSTSRISYAQQVVALARAIGGIARDDRTPRTSDPWKGAETPQGTAAPLALRVKAPPSGEQLAGAAARSVGAPATGTQDPTGVRFVRRQFAAIEAPPPAPEVSAIEVAGTEVAAGQNLPGDLIILTLSNGARRVGIFTDGNNYVYDPGDGTPVRLVPVFDAHPIPGPAGDGITATAAVIRRLLPPYTMQPAVSGSITGGMSTGLVGFPDAAVQAAWDRWGPLFVAAGNTHGIDPLIPFAFAWIETGFSDTHIYCRNGLRPTWGNGMMQFTSTTASSYGIDPCVPEQAVPAGTKMIKGLVDSYGGDLRLASMGYNAGPAISNAAKSCGCWPVAAFDRYYGSRSAWKQGITRNYSEGPESLPGRYERLKQYAQVAQATVVVGGAGPAGPATGNIVPVPGLSTGMDASIAPNATQMIAAARAQGVNLSGYAWRSPESTASLRIKNGCPDVYESPASSCRVPTARPGQSMHERGLAIDFANCGRSSPCFQWLSANAAQFGLKNLPSESWHWSVNGR